MAKAIRNIGHRPLELTFDDQTVRVFPKKTSEYFSDSYWSAGQGFALEQANKYVKDRDAVWLTQPDPEPIPAKKSKKAGSSQSAGGGEN